MTPREAVIRAIERKAAPYVPWQVDVTAGVDEALRAHFGRDDYLYACIGNHLVREKNKNHIELGNGAHRDIFGVVWKKQPGAAGDIGDIAAYQLPEPEMDGYVFPVPQAGLPAEKCDRMVREQPNRFRIFELSTTLFERAWSLRGMEALLTDFVLSPAFVSRLLGAITDYAVEVIRVACRYDIDAIMFGDDYGQQHGLLMGPTHWRAFVKPMLVRLFAEVKRYGKYVFLHSCGDLRDIMGDLVDMGLDVYNTFQPEIYDMAAFRQEYGSCLTIYGGVSTQGVFARGTAAQVREETLRAMDILGAGGGYIVAPTHQFPFGTPLSNILSFVDTVRYHQG
ncbi:MAG: uroporphyrinogen-III decarboxylase-like protein [Clostridia bacterium]|nr:uroporphyrinogen-III decarboxylase-like protein [Clostridia bacterium]